MESVMQDMADLLAGMFQELGIPESLIQNIWEREEEQKIKIGETNLCYTPSAKDSEWMITHGDDAVSLYPQSQMIDCASAFIRSWIEDSLRVITKQLHEEERKNDKDSMGDNSGTSEEVDGESDSEERLDTDVGDGDLHS